MTFWEGISVVVAVAGGVAVAVVVAVASPVVDVVVVVVVVAVAPAVAVAVVLVGVVEVVFAAVSSSGVVSFCVSFFLVVVGVDLLLLTVALVEPWSSAVVVGYQLVAVVGSVAPLVVLVVGGQDVRR